MSSILGERIKKWRKVNKIKQDYLAAKLGVTQATISRWERGVDSPSIMLKAQLDGLMDLERSNSWTMIRRLVQSSLDLVAIISQDMKIVDISVGIMRAFDIKDKRVLVGHHLNAFLMEGERDILDNLGMAFQLSEDVDSFQFKAFGDPLSHNQREYSLNDVQIFQDLSGEKFCLWRYEFFDVDNQNDVRFFSPDILQK